MALNKAKVLKSADKYVIQGKISHAIAEYQKLIKEDPTDLPLVNTLGDLYVRIGNIPEAVKCFTRLAESYDNGGFVVRAIAMYKKVSKIDPGQIQALSRLADLYLRQGLNSDARAHYLQVADSVLKKGELENAIAIYKKVGEIDPENHSLDGRTGEVYEKLGNKEGALAAYVSAGMKARRKGAFEEAADYLKKAQELDPNNLQVLLAYAEILSELGKASEGLAALNRIPLHDFKPEVLEVSFTLHLKSGNLDEAEEVASQLIELDSQYFKLQVALSKAYFLNGNLDRAAAKAGEAADFALKHEEGKLIESQLKSILHKTPDHVPTILELIKFYTLSKEHQNLPELLERAAEIYVRRELLAEAASVYLQLVQLEPHSAVHRENLRQVQERLGGSAEEIELPRLVPDMSAIAEQFISEPTLRTVAPGQQPNEPAADSSETHEGVKGLIVEGDLFAGYGLYQKAIEQYQRVIEVIPHHIEAHEKTRDLYAKGGELGKAAQECLILANIFTARSDADNASRNFTLAYQYDPSLHQEPIQPQAGEVHAQKGPELPADMPSDPPTRTVNPKRLEELLQEADFYLDLGFVSEAKASIDQYLQLGTSTDAEFQKRMRRYQGLLASQADRAAGDHAEQAAPVDSAAVAQAIKSEEFESTRVAVSSEASQPNEIEYAAGFETTAVSPDPAVPQPAAKSPELAESFDGLMIDLDQELAGSTLEKTAESTSPGGVALNTPSAQPGERAETLGLEAVFEEFKEGMEDDSEGGDPETHYHLGIAFKEMGLLEEAIGEFQRALSAQAQDIASDEFVKCCNMLGLCFVEKGLPQVAIKWFTKGLSSPGRNEETYQALRYDLACAHEMVGNTRAALDTFLDVYGVNINYRDVSEKIENLKNLING
jgi:tetratricopeptide (TPR) repeat protein